MKHSKKLWAEKITHAAPSAVPAKKNPIPGATYTSDNFDPDRIRTLSPLKLEH